MSDKFYVVRCERSDGLFTETLTRKSTWMYWDGDCCNGEIDGNERLEFDSFEDAWNFINNGADLQIEDGHEWPLGTTIEWLDEKHCHFKHPNDVKYGEPFTWIYTIEECRRQAPHEWTAYSGEIDDTNYRAALREIETDLMAMLAQVKEVLDGRG